MSIIEAADLSYSYQDAAKNALDKINISVEKGEFVAVIGRNGCGKSTLARHINVLIPLEKGKLTVAGLDASLKRNVWEIRKQCGMVFQNPDNQFVSSIVEEDIAFGLENYDYPEEQINSRIKEALRAVDMQGSEKRAPHMLSGGQKQRIAIAGVLAINPDIMIFDEVTTMLDPSGRKEVLSAIRHLNKAENKTVIMITHNIEETVSADKIIIMDKGRVIACGMPEEVLCNKKLLEEAGLAPPLPAKIYFDLKENGIELSKCPITNEELTELLCRLY